MAGVVVDAAGNLYGTLPSTVTDIAPGSYGLVYKIDTSGAETVLYSFTRGAHGGDPVTPVILEDAGPLYGTDSGDFSRIYAGVALKITLPQRNLGQCGHGIDD
jgi:hypothetical protein